MTDKEIVTLFWERDEAAIKAISDKFTTYCDRIAINILGNAEDAEECVNEVIMRAWESIPPNSPENSAGYLGKLTRNTAIDQLRKRKSEKRGGGEYDIILDELSECVSDGKDIGESAEYHELVDTINDFLKELAPLKRSICVLRYSRLEPIAEIAEKLNVKESYVLTTLARTRKKLRKHLKKRGFEV